MLSSSVDATHAGPQRNTGLWTAYLLLLLVLGLAQFWNARLFPFFQDDFDYLDHVVAVQQDVSSLFSIDHNSSGRPSTTFFFMAIQAVWGNDTIAYHTALILAHILTVWILAWSLHQLGYSFLIAAASGILFLFNVTHYVVPYWPSCQSYMGCLSAGCLAIVAYCRYSDTRQIKWYAGSIALLIVAATCHGGAMGFAILACYFAWRRGAGLRWIARTAPAIVLPCFSLSIWFLLAFPRHSQMANVTHLLDPVHILQTTLAYLGRTFLSPHWLSSAFVNGPGPVDVFVGSGIVGLAIWLALRRPGPGLDAIVWAAVVLPVFGGSSYEDYSPRYFYFSSVGPSLMIAWALISAGNRLSSIDRRLKLAIPAIATFGIIGLSHFELKTSESVFWGYIGRSYLSGRDAENGLEYLSRGLEGAPDDLDAAHYQNYGIHALFQGRDPGSILKRGIKRHQDADELTALVQVSDLWRRWSAPPTTWIEGLQNGNQQALQAAALAANNAGLHRARIGQNDHAAKLLSLSVQLVPGYTAALTNLGTVFAYQGKTREAMTVFENLYRLGDERVMPRTRAGLERVLGAEPENTRASTFLAKAHRLSRHYSEAIETLSSGLQFAPSHPDLLSEIDHLRSVLQSERDLALLAKLETVLAHHRQ